MEDRMEDLIGLNKLTTVYSAGNTWTLQQNVWFRRREKYLDQLWKKKKEINMEVFTNKLFKSTLRRELISQVLIEPYFQIIQVSPLF
jgi:hypothetical protein